MEQFCTEQQIKIDIHQKVIDSDDFDEEDDEWRREASKTCSSLKEIAAGRILTLSEVLQRCTYRVYMNRVGNLKLWIRAVNRHFWSRNVDAYEKWNFDSPIDDDDRNFVFSCMNTLDWLISHGNMSEK